MMWRFVTAKWINGVGELLELKVWPLSRDYMAFSSRGLLSSRDMTR